MRYIPDREYLYSITDDGVIFSFKGKKSKWLYRILKPHRNKKTGYLTLNILGWRGATVHNLVALTYLPNPNKYPVVRHLDNNKLNNHVSNLEWCTHQTNIQQAHDDGLCPRNTPKQKEALERIYKKRRKKVEQYTKEGDFIGAYISVRDASKSTGIQEGNISLCACGKKHHRTAGGFIWKYVTKPKRKSTTL